MISADVRIERGHGMTGPEERTASQRRPRRSPSPQQRQRDPERTKERILDAALEVFSVKGYAGARVAEIADRAGVNKQLITYYFGGKQGLYQEIGRRWRTHEQQAYPADLPLAEETRLRILDTAGGNYGSKLLAWQGLTDTGTDDPDAAERTERLQEEIAALQRRQETGEIDPDLDPAALLLITMSAANALTVYPHIARGIFRTNNAHNPDLVHHYANQLAQVLTKLRAHAPTDE
jgi:TetR/AcrR family transcriptional regulator